MLALALAFEVALGLLGWGAIAWLVTRTYPDQPGVVAQFYAALFVAISATTGCLLWLALHGLLRIQPQRAPLAYLVHGMVLSALAIFGLWLQSLRLLTPLHALLLLGLFLFFELALAIGSRES